MYIYQDLFTDEYAAQNKKKLLRKLWMNIGQIDIYLIFLSEGEDLFDIVHAGLLKQKRYPKKDLCLLGMAQGWESACALSGEIFSHFSECYGDISFKQALEADKPKLFRRF